MPEIGEVRRARDIGYKDSSKVIWQACILCGEEHWVFLKLGKPISSKCVKHNGQKQGFAENNSNWKADTDKQQTGRMRAERWYPIQPCEICGERGERHHIDGNALNNEPSNITFRCRKHHMEEDGRLVKVEVMQ